MEPTAHSQQNESTASSTETAEDLAFELNAAVRDNSIKGVLDLLERGADVNSKAGGGWTPLQSAVQANNEDLVWLLLDKGACPYARKDNGGTAFTEAAIVGNVNILELLLDHGLNINDHDNNGFTAFMEAAWYGREEALKFLYSKGANVNLRRAVSEERAKLHKGGATALMDACREGHFSAVKTLVQEMGADVNICDNRGRNALIHALKKGCAKESYKSAVSIGHFLLDCGVDVNRKDECGKTALILAVEMQSPDLVEALLEKGEIDIDDADEEGNTALMVAVEKNDCNIAKLLCEKGARTDDGNLIAVANRKRAHNMACLLRHYNAKFVPENPEDWEPKSKRWRDQLKNLYKIYRLMIGNLKIFQCIEQRIHNTSQGGIYLGLHSGTEARGYMYLCFPLWEKNLEEHLQEPEDQMDYKDGLRMIFQALRELHSLGFAHQDLHPRNFFIDLGGKIYLADFDNRRTLIEGKKELVNSDLEALGRLMLYVLTRGKKPLQQVSVEDLAADSPDYNEALDLVNSLVSHDERGLEGLSKHPFFWSKQTRFRFLKSIWNKIKVLHNEKDVFQGPNVAESFPYPWWTKEIDRMVLNIMEKPRKAKPYTNDVTDLLRLIRNLDEHPNIRISNRIGDHAEYFLKLFPALTIYVYNSLHQNPKYSHLADIQVPSL
ncbi:2-5A-dependent ribonuclease isoform X3 [Athene noctua]|uniref:2-5A-dependent ribonuclease isoform X3 n=1 Tax=Athene noctua TaxID=126797 RepID=UPI003EB9C8EB